MRKHQYKQILELIATLNEAMDEAKRQFSGKSFAAAINLLADCQDVALHIGGFIEKLEGEGTRTVQLLLGFQESLYTAAMQIETAEASFVKQLKKELHSIENSVKNELKPNQIEVAFFPYKASMWDALESIWLAAQEDPECEAYVVPIPYFDRLPGGELGQMHYEGHLYPDYVPVVDWQAYSLEERRPDVSFIHNAYDDYNFITTVHPDYYSRNLKKYTELLCYSPYFVTSDKVEEHSCTLPGVLHSDRVFVQSDKMRQAYIEAIQAFEKEQKCPGRFGNLKEKIVASGSPKFDKVINSKPEDFTLPDEWKKSIEKPDGSWKTIVLYNTSIGPILQGNEQYIAKLKSVLEMFRSREDAVLWWRPHPLSEATYSSMRPFLMDEYTQLIQAYKQEEYGIYDNTADLHRALSLSSIFYGDASSLMPMVQCMRKPIMIQNEAMNDPLAIGSICDTEEYLWFLPLHYNGLFRLDKNTRNVDYIGSFMGGKKIDWRVYHTIHKSGDKLYFSPHSAESIAIYDIQASTFEYVRLPVPDGYSYNDQSKFSRIIECGGSLYFIPLRYPGIIKLNMEDNRIEIIDDWLKPAQGITFDPEHGYFSNGVYDQARNLLVLASSCASALLIMDLNTHTTTWSPLSTGTSGHLDIVLLDGTYWLISLQRASLVNYNIVDNTSMEYSIDLEGIPADGFSQFQKIVHFSGFLYLVPSHAYRMVKFHLADRFFSYVDEFSPAMQDDSSENALGHYYYMSSNSNENIYVTENKGNQFIEFNLIDGSLRQGNITVDNGLREFLNFLIRRRQDTVFETANSCGFGEHTYAATLDSLIDFISKPHSEPWLDELLDKQVQLRRAEIAHPDGKAGIEIYDKTKRAVWTS